MITFDEYAVRSREHWALKDGTIEDQHSHIELMVIAELGEVAGLFQKEYQGYPLDGEKLKLELGDVLWTCVRAVELGELDRDEFEFQIRGWEREGYPHSWSDEALIMSVEMRDWADVLRTARCIASHHGWSLAELAEANLAKLDARYAGGVDERQLAP